MGSKPLILCVGPDPVLNTTRRLLLQSSFQVQLVENLPEAVTRLSEQRFHLVLLCYSLPDNDARAFIDFLRNLESRPKILALENQDPRFRLAPPDVEFRPSGPAALLRKAAAMAGIELPESAPPPSGRPVTREPIEPAD